MSSRNSILLVLVVLFIGAAQLQAADLTLFVGGVKPGTISYQNVKTSLDSSPVYGVRFSTNFVPLFGMEHTFAFSSDYLFPSNPAAAVKEARGFVYNSNLIINLPVRKAVPYLTAGAGIVHQYGNANLPVGTKFAFNYGGGLKFPHLAGPLGLRFDVRGYSAGITNKVNLLEVSGGLLLSFGIK